MPSATIGQQSCSTSVAAIGSTYYFLALVGTVPAGGGAFTNSATVPSQYLKQMTVVTSPTPTPPPSVSPTPAPVRPTYVYTGSYTVASATAPTTGCVTIFTTTDGSTFQTFPAASALGSGVVNAPSNGTFNVTSVGVFSALSITLSPASGSGSGTFRLDNGDTGTITITGVTTQQLPLSDIRKPK